MGFPSSNKVKKIWEEWNLQAAVLTSLFFQIILIFIAASRKRTGNKILTFLTWGAYLLADWVAAFAVGLISKGQSSECDKNPINKNLAAFWAPFLLLHLGGPDTITAFSLEDNELWLRHLLSLLIQLFAVAYVFSQSIPNELWVPVVLLFLAGTIKYSERTRAFYLACLGNFKASMLPKPEAGPNYAQLMEVYTFNKAAEVPVDIKIRKELDEGSRTRVEESFPTRPISDIEVVQNGYKFFKIFKGLIVDLMFSFHERYESRNFFFERTWKDAFRVVEVELNFMYDVLYTKMAVVHCKTGYFSRFASLVLIFLSFYSFTSLHHKLKIHRLDITVTYILLIGAVVLDLIALVKLIFSDWTIVNLKNPMGISIVSAIRERLSFDRRCRWSKSVSQHSLINYCLKERFKCFDKLADLLGLKDFLDELQYKKSRPLEDDLKEFIFGQLREKAIKAEDFEIAKTISSAKGNWVLAQERCSESISESVREQVEYDQRLLLWHIATELCYFVSPAGSDHQELTCQNREFAKLLSQYMLYLLVMQPTMMSSVAGIGQIRFLDTCEEAKRFFRSKQPGSTFGNFFKQFLCKTSPVPMLSQEEACEKLLEVETVVKPADVKGDRSKSVLFDACILARELNKLDTARRWEIMSRMWVELLCYAASHCRANTHAQQLSKGGELVSFVWLLMAHFGLGEQFRIQAGHSRAKLVVMEDDELKQSASW